METTWRDNGILIMDFNTKNSRVRLKVKDKSITRSKVIEVIFLTTEIPFVRVFGDFPVYTALCTEENANKLLKPENKAKQIHSI